MFRLGGKSLILDCFSISDTEDHLLEKDFYAMMSFLTATKDGFIYAMYLLPLSSQNTYALDL